MTKVTNGDKVKIEYEGKLDDGTVFDSSNSHEKPLEFEVGNKQVIPGFENAVMGMEKDQEKEIELKPEEAYGDYNPERIQKIPKDKIPPEAKAGSMLMMQTQNGAMMPVKVVEIDDKEATLDMNHPLAGKTLHFKLKVIEIA
jgi:FKBP-type peptidyl-prolyl cis-trans isomerase 2